MSMQNSPESLGGWKGVVIFGCSVSVLLSCLGVWLGGWLLERCQCARALLGGCYELWYALRLLRHCQVVTMGYHVVGVSQAVFFVISVEFAVTMLLLDCFWTLIGCSLWMLQCCNGCCNSWCSGWLLVLCYGFQCPGCQVGSCYCVLCDFYMWLLQHFYVVSRALLRCFLWMQPVDSSSFHLTNTDKSQLTGSEREPIRSAFPKSIVSLSSIGTSALYELLRLTMLLRNAAQDSRFRL